MKYVVTGAAGYFKSFSFYEENILRLELESLLEGTEAVFHQAAQAGVRASWGDEFAIYTDNNILASQRLLEACRSEAVSGTLKKLVYASSSSIYGDAASLPTPENTLPRPLSPYGVSKLAAENLMVLYCKEFGVPTCSLRYFTVYGPRQRPDMAFNRFSKAVLKGEKITLYDDGEQSRDFTFVDDIVEANLQAAGYAGNELVFNVGGGSRVSINQVIELISEITGKKVEVEKFERQLGDVKHTGADISLAKKEFSYLPKTNLEAGLRAEVAWLEAEMGNESSD